MFAKLRDRWVTWWRADFPEFVRSPAQSPTSARIFNGALSEPEVPLRALVPNSPTDWTHIQFLEFTHDAIVIWEMQGEGILYWNSAAEKLYGFSRHEAYRKVTHSLLRTEVTGGIPALEDALARFGIWVGELRHTTRDGRCVHVESRLAVLSQNTGRCLVLEVNRDITDQKTAAVARRNMERRLAEVRAAREAR